MRRNRIGVARFMLCAVLGHDAPCQVTAMAKGQKKSNKEIRKPKAEKKKVTAAAPGQKDAGRGLENFKS